jgi:hypothetical protein
MARYRASHAFRSASNARMASIMREHAQEAKIAAEIDRKKHGATLSPEQAKPIFEQRNDVRDVFEIARAANAALKGTAA